jgi:hypothetical protein
MTQQAAARVVPEAAPKPALVVREQVDSISNVVAADQAYLSDAIGSVSRQRRRLLQRLTRRSAADRREAVVTARQPSAKTMSDASLREAIRDGVARASAVIGLAGIALIHVLDAPGHFAGPASYIGWMYVALIIGCLGVAGALIRSSDGRAWTAAALMAVGPIVAFLLSRTVGLPASSDDIGKVGRAARHGFPVRRGIGRRAERSRRPRARRRLRRSPRATGGPISPSGAGLKARTVHGAFREHPTQTHTDPRREHPSRPPADPGARRLSRNRR